MIDAIKCWNDSTIVLSWLARPPSTWNTFVTNRIFEISQIIDPKHWWHVASEDNPADLASCGAYPKELAVNSLWWNGPSWLKEPPDTWESLPLSNLATRKGSEMSHRPHLQSR